MLCGHCGTNLPEDAPFCPLCGYAAKETVALSPHSNRASGWGLKQRLLPIRTLGTVAALVGLQALLAVTGYCLGCQLYGLRWFVPGVFDRLVGKPRPSYGDTFR